MKDALTVIHENPLAEVGQPADGAQRAVLEGEHVVLELGVQRCPVAPEEIVLPCRGVLEGCGVDGLACLERFVVQDERLRLRCERS